MAAAQRPRGISFPLILLCLALGGLLYYLAAEPLSIRPPSAIERSARELPELSKFSAREETDLAAFEETVSRPLFAESRRPPDADTTAPPIEAEPVPAPKIKAKPLRHTLIGIFMLEDNKLALLRANRKGAIVRVGVGDEVDGWKVVAITPEQIEIERDGTTQILVPKATAREKPKPAARINPRRRNPTAANQSRTAPPAAAPRSQTR